MPNTSHLTIKLARIPREVQRPDLERRKPHPRGARFKDLTGQKFKLCTVEGFAGYIDGYAAWLCRCVCGRQFIARRNSITHKPTGCGCAGKGVQHHGGSHSLEYANWHYLWRYHRERMCERWRDFKKFREDMGPKPKKRYAVGRLDRSKPYGPGNCKWMTRKQAQMGKGAKLYTFRGESLQMKDWAKRLGITLERLRQRMLKCRRYGVDISQSLEAPAGEMMRCTRSRAGRRMAKR